MSFSLSSFESDDITCFDIIKAFYALTDNELEVLSCVHKGQPLDIKSITDIIPKDRATISRSIKKLMAIGFVRSDKITLDRGGYKFMYSSLSMKEIRDKLKGFTRSYKPGKSMLIAFIAWAWIVTNLII